MLFAIVLKFNNKSESKSEKQKWFSGVLCAMFGRVASVRSNSAVISE